MKASALPVLLILLAASLSGGMRAAAAPAEPKKITAEIAALLQLLEEQGALFEPAELDRRLRLAVCQVIDPGAELLTPAEAARRREEDAGVFYGIGVQLEIRDKRPRILKVLPDGPAAAAGLPAGAAIEKIDEADTLDMALADAVARLRGYQGQPVTLQFRPPPNAADPAAAATTNAPAAPELQTVELLRSLVLMPMTGMTEPWPLQLAYMKINGIYDGSGAYMAEQLQAWSTQEVAGVILDLRGAGGADLPSVAAAASLCAPAGRPLFRVAAGRNRESAEYSARKSPLLTMPVIALIDAQTRGAAALLAAVLRNCRGAMLIGAPCRNDLVLRAPISLPDGQVLYIAMHKIELLPAAAAPAELVPDVQIPSDARIPAPPAPEKADDDIFAKISDQERQERALAERIGQDTALRRAADILLGLKALGIKTR